MHRGPQRGHAHQEVAVAEHRDRQAAGSLAAARAVASAAPTAMPGPPPMPPPPSPPSESSGCATSQVLPAQASGLRIRQVGAAAERLAQRGSQHQRRDLIACERRAAAAAESARGRLQPGARGRNSGSSAATAMSGSTGEMHIDRRQAPGNPCSSRCGPGGRARPRSPWPRRLGAARGLERAGEIDPVEAQDHIGVAQQRAGCVGSDCCRPAARAVGGATESRRRLWHRSGRRRRAPRPIRPGAPFGLAARERGPPGSAAARRLCSSSAAFAPAVRVGRGGGGRRGSGRRSATAAIRRYGSPATPASRQT